VTHEFRSAWWLPGPHAQTVGGRFLRGRRERGLRFRRERLELPDGDFLDLDFVRAARVHPTAEDSPRPLVLVLHGLEGSARSGYALETYRALAAHGVRAVGLNFRSCGGEPNRTARSYHSGDSGDLGIVVDVLRERFRDTALGAIGYSLGGNVLLKYLGERGAGARERVRAAAAISVPYDLATGARCLERGLGRLYAAFFLRSLRSKLRAKWALLEGRCDRNRAVKARTMREFDEAATAPLHGFRDAEDYYRRSSSAPFLPAIRVPTLLLHAVDDPFLPGRFVPREAIRDNPRLQAHFSERGGHVGFVAGARPWAARLWAEWEAARFVAARLREVPAGTSLEGGEG
jgi:predicted alpha/beta-fold hydrolase